MHPNATIVDAFYEAYNAHDAEAATALYASTGWHEEVAFGRKRQGREDLAAGLVGLFQMIPDVEWRERERVVSKDSIVVLYAMSAHIKPRSTSPDAPAREVELSGVHIFELGPDGISGTRDYWDVADFKRQAAG